MPRSRSCYSRFHSKDRDRLKRYWKRRRPSCRFSPWEGIRVFQFQKIEFHFHEPDGETALPSWYRDTGSVILWDGQKKGSGLLRHRQYQEQPLAVFDNFYIVMMEDPEGVLLFIEQETKGMRVLIRGIRNRNAFLILDDG